MRAAADICGFWAPKRLEAKHNLKFTNHGMGPDMSRRKQFYEIESLQISDLIAVIKTAELGSMSAAGRELGYSPAVLSKRISVVEDCLGVKLFDRNTRNLCLSSAGEMLLPKIGDILDNVKVLAGSIPVELPPDLPFGRFVFGRFATQGKDTEPAICCCMEPGIWWRLVLKKTGPAFAREDPFDWCELPGKK